MHIILVSILTVRDVLGKDRQHLYSKRDNMFDTNYLNN